MRCPRLRATSLKALRPRAAAAALRPRPPAPRSPPSLLTPALALVTAHATPVTLVVASPAPGVTLPGTSSLSSLTSEILTVLLTAATRSHEQDNRSPL